MAIDFRLNRGQSSPLQSALAGYSLGEGIRADQQDQAQQKEAEGLQQKIQTMMEDPEFNLASSLELERLSELNPQAAEASKSRFASLSAEDQRAYEQDMLMARDMMMSGNIEGGQTHLANRITKLVEGGKRPDDTIRGFMIAQRDPEYFVQGVNQMLASQEQSGNRDISYQGPKDQEPKVGRFRSIDKGTAIDIMDSATGQVTKTIPKSPTASQEAEAELKKLQAEQKRQAAIDSVFSEQDNLSLASQAADLASGLANNPNLSNVVGTQTGLSLQPTLRPESADIINQANNLMALLTKDNLSLMSGVLSESDIKLLSRIASGGLNVTEDGIVGSYEQVQKDLRQVAEKIQSTMASKQPTIDKRLFIDKQSNKLGRKLNANDIKRLRDAGFDTRQIYNMLEVQ